MQRAIFLDRDGVINAMVYNPEFGLVDSPANPGEFRLLPGVPEAICQIHALGYLAVVISNQPGIAKGKFSPALLEAMTHKMHAELAQHAARLDAVYYCYHHPQGVVAEYRRVCDCRKPRPGLLLQAAADLEIDLGRSYFIGDGITDVQAGQAAGATAILIYPSFRGYIQAELNRQQVEPNHIVRDLLEGVSLIRELDQRRLQQPINR